MAPSIIIIIIIIFNEFIKTTKPQISTKYEDCTLIYPKNLENALLIFFGRWWDQKNNNQYNSLASIQLFNNFELLFLDLNKKNGIQLQLLRWILFFFCVNRKAISILNNFSFRPQGRRWPPAHQLICYGLISITIGLAEELI